MSRSGAKHPEMPNIRMWVENVAGTKIDKAFGRQPQPPYAPMRAELRPNLPVWGQTLPISAQVVDSNKPHPRSAESDALRTALIEYNKLGIVPKLDLDVDRCTWEDVFKCMAEAQDQYEEKEKTWRGRLSLRWLFRKAGDVADQVDPILQLMPEDYGIGVLAAGISLVLMLAKTASQNRLKIFEAFQEIPMMVASAAVKLRRFPEDQELKRCGEKLNLTILKTVSNLIGSLLPERQASKIHYFSARRFNESAIDSILEGLRKDANELKTLVQDLLDDAVVETQKLVREIKGDTSTLLTQMGTLSTQGFSNNALLKEVGDDVRKQAAQAEMQAAARQEELLTKIEAERRREVEVLRCQQMLIESNKAKHALELMLKDVVVANTLELEAQNRKLQLLQIHLDERERALTPLQGLMTVPQFLIAIGADDHIGQSTTDIERIFGLRSSIHRVAEAEVMSVVQSSGFRTWLVPNRSDVVLIDGTSATSHFAGHVERVSASSILCASLLSQLGSSQPESFRLYHFCGLHAFENDELELGAGGPRGLMRRLLCHLATQAHRRHLLRLDFIDDRTYRDGLKEQRIEYLCDAFYKILQEMQSELALDLPIYCVVDGIAHYETEEWRGELAFVARMFRDIVTDTKLKPCFKLLLTGPHRVRYVHDMMGLPAEKRLLVKPANMSQAVGEAERSLVSGSEQMLVARRLQLLEKNKMAGQSMYHDDDYASDDYD
ncbi:hypothetical protein N656DRAFT_828597 [Canariomyces notabilis]|uniref:Uncharacterized protein n=1 Tax=Canariomyces notabilis TaxID=2074819 RepID=A0AAN6YU09_9PEZI|nr:hypothetical protein N656DRAFT_828597 [Canariomyces arenarius]